MLRKINVKDVADIPVPRHMKKVAKYIGWREKL
jgi:hypothetical protein